MVNPNGARAPLYNDLVQRLGAAAVVQDTAAIRRFLRDNSWLSPILSEHFSLRGPGGAAGGHAAGGAASTRESEAPAVVVDADLVVTPRNVDELRDVISLCVRHDCPITVRGGGTTNFAQSIPLEGGVVIDIRPLNKIIAVSDTEITCEAGAFQGAVDDEARRHGRELPVIVTTYATATAAGWVAGGHVGLGGTTYGTIWDGNVIGVKLLTAEDPPQEISLRGADVFPVLRTSGTTGVITEVTFPLVDAHRWQEAAVSFPTFDQACDYIDRLAEHPEFVIRAAAAQEAPLPTAFTPLTSMYPAGCAMVLLIVDARRRDDCEALAKTCGGAFHPWQITGETPRMPLAYMSYGHRMLWLKRLEPTAGFLNCYMSPQTYREQFAALKREFGSGVLLEHKYIRSRWLRGLRGLPGEGNVPAPLLTVVPGDREQVGKVMRFCDSIGVGYQNPHTFSVEETGMFPDFAPIVAFAKRVDPKGLLNPGKLHGSFFARPDEKVAS